MAPLAHHEKDYGAFQVDLGAGWELLKRDGVKALAALDVAGNPDPATSRLCAGDFVRLSD